MRGGAMAATAAKYSKHCFVLVALKSGFLPILHIGQGGQRSPAAAAGQTTIEPHCFASNLAAAPVVKPC